MVLKGRGRPAKIHRVTRKEENGAKCLDCGASEERFWIDPLTGECVCTVCGLVQDCRLISSEVYATDLTTPEETDLAIGFLGIDSKMELRQLRIQRGERPLSCEEGAGGGFQ